ncbi:Cellulose synthase-like CSLG, family GT2 [Zostera marina]|uniref:Cellulose synthase-like CSLG, family GT2 n=1 Tax=Zostera marina TaxID=29655 RepID=A0A0K9Q4J4_ZOSMR|nr:Cellulose synthase-like CSLG, family GT2 [Zostera marina]
MEDHSGDVPVLPLHTSEVDRYVHLNRIYAVVYSVGILALFYRHTLQLLSSPTVFSFVFTLSFFFADVILAVMWVLNQAYYWRPIHRRSHPERLPTVELPGLDVFICTSDPFKEPPMSVANTALSVMAYDYPMEKLSVYLSDDGGSDLTLFTFMEAAKFAKHWIPFCKMNDIMMRSPDVYFDSKTANDNHDHHNIKILYEKMKGKVEAVMMNGRVEEHHLHSEIEHIVFQKWKQERFTRQEHPSVIQILLESNKDRDITDQPLPNLIYISREKHRSVHHHFKGGSLNALLRVSKVMTNAPFILTLDCDMISNDPITPRRAMCFLLDEAMSENLAYVQFPQRFRGINESDIYGNEYTRIFSYNLLGMNGTKGPNYVGTNTFFQRRAIEGILPTCEETLKSTMTIISSTKVLDLANKVAGATYEHNTKWGCEFGFRYGSLTEDFYTGFILHCEGWRSIYCSTERPAFLGEVTPTLYDGLNQMKRWTIGLFEVVLSRHNTFTYGIKKGKC